MAMTKFESDQERRLSAVLTGHYRAIGPAAIVAALLHCKKQKIRRWENF